MRTSDRWEAMARTLAVVVLLAAIPLAVHAGTTRYDQALVRERADAAAATTVTAIVTEHPTALVQDGAATAKTWQARVAWTKAGRTHSAVVDVPRRPRRVTGSRSASAATAARCGTSHPRIWRWATAWTGP